MCNRTKRKILSAGRGTLCATLFLLATPSFFWSQGRSHAAPQKEVVVSGPYLSLTKEDVKTVFEEARVTQSLKGAQSLSLAELVSYPERYKILVGQLEDRAISKAVEERPSKAEYYRILNGIGRGIRLSKILSTADIEADKATTENVIAKTYHTSPAVIRTVVIQQWRKHRFADTLFSKLPPGYMLSNWFERELKLRFSAVTIPRVPTSIEIDRAIQEKHQDIKLKYAAERRRFVKPAKIMATRVLVPWRSPRTPADDKWVRKKAGKLRNAAIKATAIDALVVKAGYGRDQRKQGKVTLTASKHADLADKPEGHISKIQENKVGVLFFKIDTHIPVFARTMEDATVQRELAAEVLRDSDQLATAYGHAMRATTLLKADAANLTQTLEKVQGSKVLQPQPFAPFSNPLIPGIGTSKEASGRLQKIRVGEVTQPPLVVRQDYVVFRADEWLLPNLNEWYLEAPKVWPVFVGKAKKQLLATWLSRRLPKDKIKVDAKVISTLKFSSTP